MKRELKVLHQEDFPVSIFISHKAYPDEKGTERALEFIALHGPDHRHKAYPDEKGTERSSISIPSSIGSASHKAYPDEKGTESFIIISVETN